MTWEGECIRSSITITDGSTSYNITGLEAEANYTITVAASNRTGSAVSDPVTGTTGRAGKIMCVNVFTSHCIDGVSNVLVNVTIFSNPAPGQLSVTVSSTTATTISLSWSVLNGSVVESYEVSWEREGIRSSTTITDGSTSYTIRGLEAEANYTITVAASKKTGSAVSDLVTGTTGSAGKIMCESIHIDSGSSVLVNVTIFSDPAPGQPSVIVSSTTATTISLSWSAPSGSVVESYEVTWEREGIRSSTTITDGSTSYTIRGLEAEANYTITVAASKKTGSAVSDLVTGTTGSAGKIMCESIHIDGGSSVLVNVTIFSDSAPGQLSVIVSSTTATTISLSWSVPSGSVVESYEVTWEREGIRSSTTIPDGSTSYTIRGLEAEANYTITVAASKKTGSAVSDLVTGTTGSAGKIMCESIHIDGGSSVLVNVTIFSDSAPGQLSVIVSSTTATTISLSWSVPSGSVVESYEVTWEREGIRSSTTIPDGSTSYTIRGLEAEANYTITVAASKKTGSAVSDLVTGTTGRAGVCEIINIILHRQWQLL